MAPCPFNSTHVHKLSTHSNRQQEVPGKFQRDINCCCWLTHLDCPMSECQSTWGRFFSFHIHKIKASKELCSASICRSRSYQVPHVGHFAFCQVLPTFDHPRPRRYIYGSPASPHSVSISTWQYSHFKDMQYRSGFKGCSSSHGCSGMRPAFGTVEFEKMDASLISTSAPPTPGCDDWNNSFTS